MFETLDMKLSKAGFSRRAATFPTIADALGYFKDDALEYRKTVEEGWSLCYFDEIYIGQARLLGLSDSKLNPEDFVVYIRGDDLREKAKSD